MYSIHCRAIVWDNVLDKYRLRVVQAEVMQLFSNTTDKVYAFNRLEAFGTDSVSRDIRFRCDHKK